MQAGTPSLPPAFTAPRGKFPVTLSHSLDYRGWRGVAERMPGTRVSQFAPGIMWRVVFFYHI